MSEKENKGKLNIELPEEVATGVYANLAVITHSPAEFVMDFIQVMPGMPKAKVRGRVVMSPHHVKRLLGALAGGKFFVYPFGFWLHESSCPSCASGILSSAADYSRAFTRITTSLGAMNAPWK